MDYSSYPYAGNPRRFVAVAMPNGDARFGVEGPLVFVTEQRGHCQDRPKFLTRGEAEQLRDELHAALRTFGIASSMAQDCQRSSGLSASGEEERPTAYRGPYPIRDHGTLADIGFITQEETP